MKDIAPRKSRTSGLSMRGTRNLPLSYLVVLAICGCVIAVGFLLAARQHFVSMDLGMKNSKLRKQLDDVETEQRRLILAREVALSPKEITKTARDLGFVDTLEQALAVPVPVVKTAEPATASKAMLITSKAPSAGPTLAKTAYQRPVTSVARSEPPKKPDARKPSRNG